MHRSLLIPLAAASFAAAPLATACADSAAPDVDAALAAMAPPDVDDGGLTNAATDLTAVMEDGEIFGACDRYFAGDDDRRTMLLCGKWMFFYATFEGAGPPLAMLELLAQELPEEIGDGWTGVGQIPDPYSDTGMPLGWTFSYDAAEGRADLDQPAPIAAMTCAACHLGQLPDGRYAVGAPNVDYDYGRQLLIMSLVPRLLTGEPASMHAPEAVAAVRDVVAAFDGDAERRQRFLAAMLPILDAGITPPAAVDHEVQRAQARWRTGTLDTFMAPLEPDDGLDIPTRIMPLYEIATAEEQAAHGMPHAMLGWAAGAPNLENFVDFFVTWFGDRTAWPPERQRPLVEYVKTLRRPTPPAPSDPAAVARGARAFVERGCVDCHGGPRGGSATHFPLDAIGTDAQLARFLDPEGDGEPCCGLDGTLGPGLTAGVKAPRLVGLWAEPRLLHNGSVDGLEALFCLSGQRPTVSTPGYSDDGHLDLCDDLSPDDKRDLIAFLESL